MQQFYRPDGDSTQRRGVLADVELPSVTTYLDVGEADLDYPLPFDRIAPAELQAVRRRDPAICQQLRRLSEQRVANSEKFQKVVRNIARYKDQKAKKYITLNEAKFLKERSELNADQEEEKAIDQLLDSSVKRDYYLDEAMAITADYLGLEQLAKSQPPIDGVGSAVSKTEAGRRRRRISIAFGFGQCGLGLGRPVTSGSSSVGRASASQAECRGFEPLLPLNRKPVDSRCQRVFSVGSMRRCGDSVGSGLA